MQGWRLIFHQRTDESGMFLGLIRRRTGAAAGMNIPHPLRNGPRPVCAAPLELGQQWRGGKMTISASDILGSVVLRQGHWPVPTIGRRRGRLGGP